MADKSARRRAGMYRHRAHALTEQAKEAREECDRRHMLELADIYERTADNLAPASPPVSESATVFVRRK